MKILVTGGAGFIGSRLVNKLVEQKHEVVVLDNLSAGKKENVNAKASLVMGDIKDSFEVAKAIKGCSAVFHLAALTDARSADDNAMYQANFLGAKNVFDAALAKKIKIIFTSSAAVYGNVEIPNREDAQCKPLSQYGKSKLLAERYLAQKKADFFAARLFNVYGPGGKSAVNKFCKEITDFKDVTVYGSGMQTRDYVYVDDVVDALILGLNNSGVCNIGTGHDTAVVSLIEMIHNMTRCKPNIKNEAPAQGEIGRSKADVTKAQKMGWEPSVALEDGIKLVLDSIGYKKMI